MRRCCLAWLLLFVMMPMAGAVEPGEALKDPVLENRARALSTGLRCLVCQNQSIDDSNAPLARDLRLLVRERLVAGDSDDDVINYVVARYGEFVLLRPRLGWHTLLLWLGPVVLLGFGVIFLVYNIRRGRKGTVTEAAPVSLTSDERAEVKKLLDAGN